MKFYFAMLNFTSCYIYHIYFLNVSSFYCSYSPLIECWDLLRNVGFMLIWMCSYDLHNISIWFNCLGLKESFRVNNLGSKNIFAFPIFIYSSRREKIRLFCGVGTQFIAGSFFFFCLETQVVCKDFLFGIRNLSAQLLLNDTLLHY